MKTCLLHMTSPALGCLFHFVFATRVLSTSRSCLSPSLLSPQTSSEGLSADESRCLGTPLIELGIPERKVAALLMKRLELFLNLALNEKALSPAVVQKEG